MTTARLTVIGIITSDFERSVRFYRRLGVPFPDGAESSEHLHASAPLGGDVQLMIDAESVIKGFDPEWHAPEGPPRTTIAFECDMPTEVDALYAEAIEAGATAHKEPWDAFWGQRYAQVRDFDGNAVDIFANLPRDEGSSAAS